MTTVYNKQKREVCLEYNNTIIKNNKMKKKLTMLLTLILYLTDTACTYNLYYILSSIYFYNTIN